ISVTMGGTATITATPVLAYPDRPEGVDTTATWTSSNGYVSVNGGVVTARTDLTSETGSLTDTVTVKIGDRTATCIVVITDVTIPVVATPRPTEAPTPEPEPTPEPAPVETPRPVIDQQPEAEQSVSEQTDTE
ncbi:MAG: hypothetical protein IKJ05_05460, partial [Oscillospiraceae bacterium]|nr:hypothetical protein [Oscillospiraceae bacterium]